MSHPPMTARELDYRPRLHFTATRNWLNDPNGLVFSAGVYHLFFQYNPRGVEHGHMSWGHATSRDLLRWTEHEVALPERETHSIYSGSAVTDWWNTSALAATGATEPPLVAMYTGHRGAAPSRPQREAQFLACSLDAGRTWRYPLDTPVLDEAASDFRDPKVLWHPETQRWVMVLVRPNERQVAFYTSTNLRNWTPESTFGPAGNTAGIWEVPDLFALHDARGERHWVLKVDFNPGGPNGGSGGQYFIGSFDGRAFQAQTPPQTIDYGHDFYAALTWSGLDFEPTGQTGNAPDDRTSDPAPGRPGSNRPRLEYPTWIAWMNNWQYAARLPTAPWKGALSLPRALSLRDTPEGLRLAQHPVKQFEALRGEPRGLSGTLGAQTLRPGCAHEVQLSWPATAQPFSLQLLSTEREEARLDVNPAGGELRVTRPNPAAGEPPPGFAGMVTAPIPAGAGRLRLIVDACSLEVFAAHGTMCLTELFFPAAPLTRLELAALPGVEGQIWPLATTRAG